MAERKNLYNIPKEKLPSPLYILLELFEIETQPFRKVHRLIDAFEWAIKWHTILTLSWLMKILGPNLSAQMKILLADGLRGPTLGLWVRFFRAALEKLSELKNIPFAMDEFQKLNQLIQENGIIEFRNSYAHEATHPDEKCLEDISEKYPVLLELINSRIFLEIDLIVADENGSWLLKGGRKERVESRLDPEGAWAGRSSIEPALDLWPLGSFMEEPRAVKTRRFFFFNSIKSKKIEQINYEMAQFLRNSDIWERFHLVFPLKEWGNEIIPELDIFRARIELLMSNFKGRNEERRKLREFCLSSEGGLMVWGNPGIGKSALLARVLQEVKGKVPVEDKGTDPDKEKEVQYPPVIEYFIHKSSGTDRPDLFLRHLNARLDNLFGITGIAEGEGLQEMKDALETRLKYVEDNLKKPSLILFIDGLDECPEILPLIPFPRPWMKLLLASRPEPDITKWFEQSRSREFLEPEIIGNLNENDVWAILYDSINKYEVEFDQEFIKEISHESQRNPLYLKLLCEQIFRQDGIVGDIKSIPAKYQDLYEKRTLELDKTVKGKNTLKILKFLAVAKDMLDIDAIAEFLELNCLQVEAALETCRDLLFANDDHQEVERFQVFHDSLRKWVVNNYAKECGDLSLSLADLCFNYSKLESDGARKYALQFAADHLYDNNDHESLWTLLQNEDYRNEQINVFGIYQPTFRSLEKGIEMYISRCQNNPEDDPRLCWIALKAGEIGYKAQNDISDAFKRVKNGEIEDKTRISRALQRLEVLDEENFFKASILLLWIEANRQKNEISNPEKRRPENAAQIIEAMDARISEGTRTVDWSNFFEPKFIICWSAYFLYVFPTLKINKIILRASIKHDFIQTFYHLDSIDNRYLTESFLNLLISTIEPMEDLEYKLNTMTTIAEVLIKFGENKKADIVIENAIKFIESVDETALKIKLMISIAELLYKSNDLKRNKQIINEALKNSEKMKEEKEYIDSLYIIMDAIVNIGDVQACDEIIDRILSNVDGYDKTEKVRTISKKIINTGNVNKALELMVNNIDDSSRYDYKDEIVMIINRKIKDGKFADVKDIVSDFNISGLSLLMCAFDELGCCEESKIIAEKYIAEPSSIYKELNEIIRVIAEKGNERQAYILANKWGSNLLFDTILYIVEMYANQRKMSLCDQILSEGFEIACGLENYQKQEAYGKIVEGWATTNKIEKALELLENIGNDEIFFKSICRVIKSLAESGEYKKAEALVNNIDSSIEWRKKTALKIILKEIVKSGKCKIAIDWLREKFVDYIDKYECINELSESLIKSGHYEQLISLAEEIDDNETKSRLVNDLIIKLSEIEKCDKLDIIIERLLNVINETKSDNSCNLKKISGLLNDKNLHDVSVSIVEKISNDNERNLAISYAVASMFFSEPLADNNIKLFEKVIKTKEIFKDIKKELKIMNKIVCALLKSKKFRSALNVCGTIAVEDEKFLALFDVLKAIFTDKTSIDMAILDNVFKIAESFESDYYKSQILLYSAQKLFQYGESKKSSIILSEVYKLSERFNNDDNKKLYLLVRISEALLYAKDIAQFDIIYGKVIKLISNTDYCFGIFSTTRVEEISDLIQMIDDPVRREKMINQLYKIIENKNLYGSQKLSVLCDLNSSVLKFNIKELASEIFEKCCALLSKINNEYEKNHFTVKFIVSMVLAGALDKALEIAQKFDSSIEAQVLASIFIKAHEMKDLVTSRKSFDNIIAIIDHLDDGIQKLSALSTFIKSLAEVKDLDQCISKFDQYLELCTCLKYDDEIIDAYIQSIDTIMEIYKYHEKCDYLLKPISQKLRSVEISNKCKKNINLYIQNSLIENFSSPLLYLRDSVGIFPFDKELAYSGAVSIMIAELIENRLDNFKNIIKLCDSLDLNDIIDFENITL